MSNREDKYEDDYGLVGDAREECSSGRSKGTPGTRPDKIYKESLRFRRPMLLGTANKDGRPKERVPYKSHWRLRKDARRKNKEDFENGKTTPSTDMIKKFGIKVGMPEIQEYEGRGTVEVEWEQKYGQAYRPKRR
ncbi:hypothetical protein OAA99_02475 [Omnitrophica bacterium]|nr:hypothetical protein [Candidatus Omnitrophota bacterium]